MATAYKIREMLVRATPAGNNTTVTFPDAVKAGDTLFVIAGGGSNPYGMSGDSLSGNSWTEISGAQQSGQEAQGNAWSRVMDADQPAGTVTATIQWDGGDDCGIALVHYRGDISYSLDFVERTGSVGSSGSAIDVGFTALANSTTYFYSFQRNSGGEAATVDSGAQIMLGSGAIGNQGVSLYRQQFPDADGTPAWALTAGRSGAYLVGLSIFVSVAGAWIASDPFWFEEGALNYSNHPNLIDQDVEDTHVVSPASDGLEQPSEQASADAVWNLAVRYNDGGHYVTTRYASDYYGSYALPSSFSQFNNLGSTGADYITSWHTSLAPVPVYANAPSPDPTVPSDPNAYDVEFGDDQRLDLRFTATPREILAFANTDIGTPASTWYHWTIYAETGVDVDYTVPAVRSRSELLALTQVAEETYSGDIAATDPPGATIDLGDLGLTPDYTGWVRLFPVDHFTKTGTCLPPMTGHTDQSGVSGFFDYSVEGLHQKQYRYLYRELVPLVPIEGAMGPNNRRFSPRRGS